LEQKALELQPLQPLPPHKQMQHSQPPNRPALRQTAATAAEQAKPNGEPTSCSNSRAPSPSSGPNQPAFELSSMQYSAPFTLAASGETAPQLVLLVGCCTCKSCLHKLACRELGRRRQCLTQAGCSAGTAQQGCACLQPLSHVWCSVV
jgi:hypothetical protein